MARISVQEPIEGEPEAVESATTDNQIPETAAATPDVSPPVEQPIKPRRSFKLKPNTIYIGVCALVVIVLVGALISLMHNQRNLKKENNQLKLSSPQANTKDEVEQLKNEIGQFLDLPADETPTVATVSDASKVKGQSFFVNAQNGDKVLLFAKAGKAILYRPSTKKIIEVAPINLNASPTAPTLSPTTPPVSGAQR